MGKWKQIRCGLDPDLRFDMDADPQELNNRAADPAAVGALAELRAIADGRWNFATYDAAVRASQARRLMVCEALRNGAYYPWDYQPLQKASERYMRNHMDLNILEESKRFPRGEQAGPSPAPSVKQASQRSRMLVAGGHASAIP